MHGDVELPLEAPSPLPLLLEPAGYLVYDVSQSRCHAPGWVARCRSQNDVRAALQWSARSGLDARAVGCGHSWSSVGDVATGGVSVDTRGMSRLLWCTENVVCVQPGMTVRNLSAALHHRGLCLPSLPVLLRQTVGGAVSTGSHGSSLQHGTLSDSVSSVVVVSPDGTRVTELVEGDVQLKAARMGLGRAGVLIEVRLNVVNLYNVAKKGDCCRYETVRRRREHYGTSSSSKCNCCATFALFSQQSRL